MDNSSARLRDHILKAREIARKGDLFTLSKDERQRVAEEGRVLLDKLDALARNCLVIGLLGGTGVGKSTLMNALAGAPISSASHRRPHTDATLIYRHGEAPLPFTPDPEMVWREFTHTREAVRQIILCDLPDYDSLLTGHRRQVLKFMENVDVLIWLTSPEKYGDGTFYEFLKLAPKSQHNFYFAVNKADILFDGRSAEEGFEEMRRVSADFQGHLRKADIADPAIYILSAAEAFSESALSSWNQFPSLRQEVFRRRDLKEIEAIKTGNLDKEYARYLERFETELANLDAMHDILTGIMARIREGGAEDRSFIQEAVHAGMDESVRVEVRSQIEDSSLLAGPGYGMAAFMERWKIQGQPKDETEEAQSLGIAAGRAAQVFQRRIEHSANTIMSGLMRKGANPAMTEQIDQRVNPEGYMTRLDEKIEREVAGRFASARRGSHLMFRTSQYLVYLFLLATLMFALAGKEAWQDLYANRSLPSLLNFTFTAFYNLFSPAGLAALGSYALMNLFAGLWFYRRYRVLIERKTTEAINSFVKSVGDLWQEVADHIASALEEYDRSLEMTARSLRGLQKNNPSKRLDQTGR